MSTTLQSFNRSSGSLLVALNSHANSRPSRQPFRTATPILRTSPLDSLCYLLHKSTLVVYAC